MKKNKGFISMTLVYSFLTIFLFIMAAIIASQTEKSNFVNYVNDKVNEDMDNLKGKSSTLLKRMLEDNAVTDGKIFTIGSVADDSHGNGKGLYYIDGGTGTDVVTDENNDGVGSRIYFYRGNVANNNVMIKKVSSDTTNYCFKIIRTNEDGSIRMIYTGKSSNNRCPGTLDIESTAFSKDYNDPPQANDNAFVGYMNGKAETLLLGSASSIFNERIEAEHSDWKHSRYLDTHNYYEHDNDVIVVGENELPKYFYLYDNHIEYNDNESAAKKIVDKWFKNNISTISTIVADTIYCADRSVADPVTTGYANIQTDYVKRKIAANNYSFKCEQKEDRLSLTIYNGGTSNAINALYYSVGLPTVADVIYAGGSYDNNNTDYYLNLGNDYWTMSPYEYNGVAKELYVSSSGALKSASVLSSKKVYPVISLKPDVIVTDGKGTTDNPYIITVSEMIVTP